MKGPSRDAIWRAAAIGGWFLVMAAIYDERIIVAYGWMAITGLIFVGIVRDVGEHSRNQHLGKPNG